MYDGKEQFFDGASLFKDFLILFVYQSFHLYHFLNLLLDKRARRVAKMCVRVLACSYVSVSPFLFPPSFLWRASKEASSQARKQERKQARRHVRKQSRNQAKKQARRKESRTRKQANNTCTDLSPKQAICILKSFPYNFKVFQSNKVISVALLVAPRTHGWLPHSKVFETHVGHVLE